ncbi:histidine kinase [Actinoplanes sp. NPDC048791]|uniref:sensor histidine kinase n=1 Tax=Actinoplanes sp. NPDC048791 TaxID=3154623 RepID=UPI0033E8ADFA
MRADILRVQRTDVAVALVVTALTLTPSLVPHVRPWWFVTLAVLMSAPVLWRRHAILSTGVIVGSATTLMAITAQSLPQSVLLLPYGVLVCTYTFAAADLSRTRRTIGITGLVVGVALSLIVPREDLETYRYLVTVIVAAYALGVGARARRARRDAVREREGRIREERAAAVARERTRIARDMHDIVTHSVGLILIQAETGPLVLRNHPERAKAVFESIAAAGRDAVGQLRLILGTLRESDSVLGATREPRPGIGALPGLVDNARRAGLEASAEVHGEPRDLSCDTDTAAYRVVQESLTNTIRHARAKTVNVCLHWNADNLQIDVADDGRGAGDVREGYGMIGMRERVAACGGRLTIQPGSPGFTVTAILPIG